MAETPSMLPIGPELLKTLAGKGWGRPAMRAIIVACASAWEADRRQRHMEAVRFLSQILAWRASCEDAEEREAELKKAAQAFVAQGTDWIFDSEPPLGKGTSSLDVAFNELVAALPGRKSEMPEIDEMVDVIEGLLGIVCRCASYPIGEDHTDEDQIVIRGWQVLNRHGRLCDLAEEETTCTCVENPQDEQYLLVNDHCPIHGKEKP